MTSKFSAHKRLRHFCYASISGVMLSAFALHAETAEYEEVAVELAIGALCKHAYGDDVLFSLIENNFRELGKKAFPETSKTEWNDVVAQVVYSVSQEEADPSNPFTLGFCEMLRSKYLP